MCICIGRFPEIFNVYRLKHHVSASKTRSILGSDLKHPDPHSSRINKTADVMLGNLWRQNIYLDSATLEQSPSPSWVLLVEVLQCPLWVGHVSRARELQQYWFWAWLPNTATAHRPASALELTFFLYDHSLMSLLSFFWPVSPIHPIPLFPPASSLDLDFYYFLVIFWSRCFLLWLFCISKCSFTKVFTWVFCVFLRLTNIPNSVF